MNNVNNVNSVKHETKVREFYDSAGVCYETIMGESWHHGDPEAEARGVSIPEAARLLEETLMKESGLQPGGWALDFGSGVGGPTLYMSKVTGAHFIGVTNNDSLNRKARARASEYNATDKVHFLTIEDTDYQNLPFPSASFDAVTFYESVCHLPDKAAFFREVFRVLKPGGRLVGTDWLQRAFGENQTEEQIMKYMQPINEWTFIPWHGTVEGYRKMMTEAGLTVSVARDLFEGKKCWGSTPTSQSSEWTEYQGPEAQYFIKSKLALDAAREAGVFTVGMFVATKPR